MVIPERMREITPEWLTHALRRAGTLSRIRVRSVALDPIGSFSNQLWRVHLRYDGEEPGAPETLVLKRLKPEPSRDAGHSLAGEIRFYRELGDALPVRAPRFHFGAAAGDHALLLMEDVAGFTPIDWWRGATRGHSELALEALAKLHGCFVGRVSRFDWIPSFGDSAHLAALGESYASEWTSKRDFFLERVPAFVEIGDALVGRLPESLCVLGEPGTLLHGDAHFENLALTEETDGRGSILFHDWAGVRRGSPSFDVAVFLVMSFPPERRRQVERELVSHHAEMLRGEGTLELGDPWEGYRRGVLGWAVRLVHFMRPFPREGSVVDGPGLMVLERCAAAPVDLAVGELIG